MKKLLLINIFVLLSSLALAADMLKYDWSQDDRNTRVVLKVANYNKMPITVKSVMVKYKDGDKIKTCLDEDPDVAIQPEKMVLIGKLGLNCIGITKRVTYSAAATPEVAHAQEDAKTVVRDVMVDVKYLDANGAPAMQSSTVGLMFAKYYK